MAEFKIPAPEAPAEEWGRLAVSIPGWRWMPGMAYAYAEACPDYGWCDHEPGDDSDAPECQGARHWIEQDAARHPAWLTPPVVASYNDGWQCFASPVLRGGRLGDDPDTVFNPYGWGGFATPSDVADETCSLFPDPDDPATEGCLLRLLGGACRSVRRLPSGEWSVTHTNSLGWAATGPYAHTAGRALIAVAAALGEWPGGAE